MARIRELLRSWPILDLLAVVAILVPLLIAWGDVQPRKSASSEARALSASTVGTAVTGSMTVASILLAAALVGLQLGKSLPEKGRTHIKYAITWAAVSLLVGAYILALLPSRVVEYDVSYDWRIGIAGGLQLMIVAIATFRILFGLRVSLA